LSGRFQQFITGPILKLAQTAEMIAEKSDYSLRAEKTVGDEVGDFTDAFNQMLARIERQDAELRCEIDERHKAEAETKRLNAELFDTSRRAGMAEVATGVLHNVGNVLNSVNVSTTLVADKIRNSSSSNLTKAAALLRENEADM